MGQAEPENQILYRYQQECCHDANLDCAVCLPDAGLYQIQVEIEKSMQQILRLLQLNLFEKRDLMALLRGDPPHAKQTNINQIALL